MTALAFGVAAATTQKPVLRWISLVLIALSVAAAIKQANDQQRALDTTIEAGRRNDELVKAQTNGPTKDGK